MVLGYRLQRLQRCGAIDNIMLARANFLQRALALTRDRAAWITGYVLQPDSEATKIRDRTARWLDNGPATRDENQQNRR